MAAALLAVSLLNAYLAAQATERRIEQQLRTIAHTLRDSTFPLTENVLAQMHGLSGADFLITDDSGRVTIASRPLAQQLSVAGVRDDWRQLGLARASTTEDGSYYQMALRLNEQTRRATASGSSHVLHILFSADELGQARRQAMWPSLAVGAAALLVVVLLAFSLARSIGRPIQQLRRDVHRLGEADFRPIDLPARDDEIRDLAIDINHLASELNALRHTIRQTERLTLLGQLSGGLAHHLRNDVTGARMAIQLHQRSCRDADPEALDVALRQLTLAEAHLRRFLATGAPRPLERARHDLRTIVEESLRLVEPALAHRQIRLQRKLPGASIEVDVDAELLRNAILNLIFNAADAAGSDGWVHVELRMRQTGTIDMAAEEPPTATPASGDRATLWVFDSGPGPSPEIMARLFEPFATTKPEGAGLGLSVSRSLVEAHGGSLTFERLDGVTSFAISLPLVAPSHHDTNSPDHALSTSHGDET